MSAVSEIMPPKVKNGRPLVEILLELIDSLAPDARAMLINELKSRLAGNLAADGRGHDPELELLADAWALYFEVLPPWERQWLLQHLEAHNADK